VFILDSHCDTPTQIVRQRDISIDNPYAQVDLPKLRQGHVNAAFFALYIPPQMKTDEAFEYAKSMLLKTRQALEKEHDVEIVCDAAQALKNKERGVISIFISLENASPIGRDINRFKWFYDNGIRCITLCHNSDNEVCDSAAGNAIHSGLSDFGRELVSAMNEYGVLVDCAHVSDKTFYDVLEYSKRPFVSTHSCCRALCGHRRNMTDDMIRAIASKGGVIAINFYPAFLDDGSAHLMNDDVDEMPPEELYRLPRASYTRIVDHIDHAVKIAGPDHVGIGSDFDGICVPPTGMDNVSQINNIFEEMRRRGYSEKDIEKIAGANMLRVFNDVRVRI